MSFRIFFPCQRWLATDKDDGQIYRVLVPADHKLKSLGSKGAQAIRDEIALEAQGKGVLCTNVEILKLYILKFDVIYFIYHSKRVTIIKEDTINLNWTESSTPYSLYVFP